jgi:hypothetical protein
MTVDELKALITDWAELVAYGDDSGVLPEQRRVALANAEQATKLIDSLANAKSRDDDEWDNMTIAEVIRLSQNPQRRAD